MNVTQVFKLSCDLSALGGLLKESKLSVLRCTQRLLGVICHTYRVTFFFFLGLRKFYPNIRFSGSATIKLPTQVYITLSKIKM